MLGKYLSLNNKKKIRIFGFGILLLAATFSLPDLFLYRGALLNNAGIDLDSVLWVAAAIICVVRFILGVKIGQRFFALCLLLLAPFFLFTSILLIILDSVVHPNFTYGLLHISTETYSHIALFFPVFLVPLFDLNVVKKYWRMVIFSSGVLLFCLYVYLKWRLPDVFYALDREDSVVEYAHAVLYFLSSILAVLSFRFVRGLKINGLLKKSWRILFALSAIVLFVLAGEEISWGQRIIGIETPEALKEINEQDETTLHNVSFIFRYVYDAYLLMGVYGITSWLLFHLNIKLFGVKIGEYFRPVLSRWYLIPYFMVITGYVVWRYSVTDNSFDVWEEAAELFPAIAVFIIFYRGYIFVKNKKKK